MKRKYISYFSQKVVLFHFVFFIIIKMATGCHEIFETVNVFANIFSIVCFLTSLKNVSFYSIQLATMQQISLFMLFL